MAAERRLIIGIGNPDRGDDGAGHEVVRLLKGRVPKGVVLLLQTGEAIALVDCFRGADTVYLIDAAASETVPGTIHRFDPTMEPLPSSLKEVSSHGFGLGQAVELARALGILPRRCIVYAIEGARFEADTAVTPAVLQAAKEVRGRILREMTLPDGGDAGERPL